MALELKPDSRWWYARFLVNGKLRRFPLMEKKGGEDVRIEVKGKRPPSMRHPEKGDAQFLESYRRARAAHDRLKEEELTGVAVEDLAQRIIEAKTGTRLDFVKIKAVPEAWAAIPRKRPPSPQYTQTSKATLRRFAAFMRDRFPMVEDLAGVRADQVRAFMESEERRGISPRTWNVSLQLLKTVFSKLEPNADAYRAFLKKTAMKDEDPVHRQPFKDDESEAIIEAARTDEVLRGPIVTALCTAMRRGDCCLLKWSSVDMEAGFIEVRTSKTGETAEIPILPALREVLGDAEKKGAYAFPKAAALYQEDKNELDKRLRRVLALAGFVDEKTAARIQKNKGGTATPERKALPVEELRRKGLKAIAGANISEAKRDRMEAVFMAYLAGQGLPAIARGLGLSKSTVSLHLNAIEELTGAAVLRRRPASPVPESVRGAIHGERGQGVMRRASVRGWHSFRVAFVTRALAAGMPEELVRRVTGHTAVDVVRRHYFKPGREEFKREFERAMPRFLMNGTKTKDEQLKEIIEGMTAKTLKRDKSRLLAIIAGDDMKESRPRGRYK